MDSSFQESIAMKGSIRDWRKALQTPATYRVGNAVRLQPQFIFLVILITVLLLLLFGFVWSSNFEPHPVGKWSYSTREYNLTYPLTTPLVAGGFITFRIGIVADMDTNSKSATKPHTYNSYFKRGHLTYNAVQNQVTVTWDTEPAVLLTSTYSHKGRGMELSELIVYDGRLLTFDDRSGMVSSNSLKIAN